MDQGNPAMADASAVKVFGTEMVIDCYRLAPRSHEARRGIDADAASRGARCSTWLIWRPRTDSAMVNTFGGGVNEVQRDIIAMAGLQLPARVTLGESRKRQRC